MESVTIRKAETSERGAIIKMHLALQKHLENSNSSIWRHTEEKRRVLKQQYAEQLVDENSLVLIAAVEAHVVGFLLATVSSRTEYVPSIVGTLSSVYVRRNYRRQGIGSQLIKEACRFFSLKQAEQIYVRYVLGNSEGEGFWKQLGFRPILVTAGSPRNKIEDRIDSR